MWFPNREGLQTAARCITEWQWHIALLIVFDRLELAVRIGGVPREATIVGISCPAAGHSGLIHQDPVWNSRDLYIKHCM